MFYIDKYSFAATLLGFGNYVQRNGGLARRFGAVYFDDSALGNTADAHGKIKCNRAGRDSVDIQSTVLSKFHYGAFAKLSFYLTYRCFQCLLLIISHDLILRHQKVAPNVLIKCSYLKNYFYCIVNNKYQSRRKE